MDRDGDFSAIKLDARTARNRSGTRRSNFPNRTITISEGEQERGLPLDVSQRSLTNDREIEIEATIAPRDRVRRICVSRARRILFTTAIRNAK